MRIVHQSCRGMHQPIGAPDYATMTYREQLAFLVGIQNTLAAFPGPPAICSVHQERPGIWVVHPTTDEQGPFTLEEIEYYMRFFSRRK